MSPKNDQLISVEQMTAVDIFKPNSIDKILNAIRTDALAEISDSTTPDGRKRIISRAAQISKTKIRLDELGKQLVTGWKKKSKAVDQDRKKARDTLDALRDEIRQPVTDWENIEKIRVATIKNRIEEFNRLNISVSLLTGVELCSAELQARIDIINNHDIDDTFEEFQDEARQTKNNALVGLKAAFIVKLEKEKTEELAREIKEQKRLEEKKQHEEEIAKQAADRARDEERARIKAELLELEQSKVLAQKKAADALNLLKQQQETAAREKAERIKQAEHDKEVELRAEQAKEAQNKPIETTITPKSHSDTKHQRQCNRDALLAFEKAGITPETGRLVLQLIATGKVPRVTINY